MKFNFIHFVFVASVVSGCRPGPIDPPMELNFNRVEVSPSVEGLAENHPLRQIAVDNLWLKTTGKNGQGERAIIAHIGSGVDFTNTDLRNALWMNPGEVGETRAKNGFDDDGNGFADDVVGYDFFSGDGSPYDWHGHDTFTAGLMVGAGLKESQVRGLAPNASLMVLRYLGPDGRGNPMDAYMAFEYAVQNGADVIYFNWPQGGFGKSGDQAIIRAIAMAGENNILVVVPSGNDGNQNIPHLIASGDLQKMTNVLVVSGVDQSGRLMETSNSGVKIATVAAPASGAISFLTGHELSDQLQTSSVAAAYVASAAALMTGLPGMGKVSRIREALLSSVQYREDGRLAVLSGGSVNFSSDLSSRK